VVDDAAPDAEAAVLVAALVLAVALVLATPLVLATAPVLDVDAVAPSDDKAASRAVINPPSGGGGAAAALEDSAAVPDCFANSADGLVREFVGPVPDTEVTFITSLLINTVVKSFAVGRTSLLQAIFRPWTRISQAGFGKTR
jgi:hypothetical protein